MDLGIDGKVALVTGASKGLGLGIAAELAAEDARVAISSRSRERIEAAADTIGARPIAAIMLSNAHRGGMLAAFTTLARQLAGDSITFNSLLTGRIATDRVIENAGGSLEAAQAAAAEQVPAGRLGTVEEFAAAAAFL